jgi:hypothetical protein
MKRNLKDAGYKRNTSITLLTLGQACQFRFQFTAIWAQFGQEPANLTKLY